MTCAHYTSMVNHTKHVVIKSADVVKITADTNLATLDCWELLLIFRTPNFDETYLNLNF